MTLVSFVLLPISTPLQVISTQVNSTFLTAMTADEVAYRLPPKPELPSATPICNVSEQSAPTARLNPHGLVGAGYCGREGQTTPNDLQSLFQWSWRPPSEACSQYSHWSAARSAAASSVSGLISFEAPDQSIRYVKPKNGGEPCVVKGQQCALIVGMKRKISPVAFPLVEVVLKAENARDDEYELVLKPSGTNLSLSQRFRKWHSNFLNKFQFVARNVTSNCSHVDKGGYKSAGREVVVVIAEEAFANQSIPENGRDYDVSVRIQGRILHGQVPITVVNPSEQKE